MKNSERGVILFIALWFLSLLTVFALYLGFNTRQKILVVKRLDERTRLHYIAEAGVRRAILELHKDTSTDIDTLNDAWSNSERLFRKRSVGNGSYSISHISFSGLSGQRREIYGIVDEERKININTAKQDVIRRLFRNLGIDKIKAQNVAAAIVDWRDRDNQLSIPLGSAEDRYYENLEHPYEAKDDKIQVLNELFLIRDMNKEIFDKIDDFVTIYGKGRVNINTAPAEVLLALGLYKSVVKKIILFRQGEDRLAGTPDDNFFTDSQNAVSELSQFVNLSPSETANFTNLISEGAVTTSSSNFMVISRARLNSANNCHQIICVYERLLQQAEETDLYGNKGKAGIITYWWEK